MTIHRFDEERFTKFRNFIHEHFGMYYADVKKDLLRIKIDKCLMKTGIQSYDDYFQLISEDKDGAYLRHFIDEITVNKTEFFRESEQFDWIRNQSTQILKENPYIAKEGQIRVWSMACSTGEEPYSLAMILREVFPAYQTRILATDVSNRVLKIAVEGVYPESLKNEVAAEYLRRYFVKVAGGFAVSQEIRSMISFRHFNLLNAFPFQGKFDMIFCRNVMIYFDNPTQQKIVLKIQHCLANGGLLFMGLSESMVNKNTKLHPLKSSIYLNKIS